jgi:hypothetical protein
MTKIIPTRYDNTKCRACSRHIAHGENVRWTKGEKGVTCMNCPGHAVTPAPVDATTLRIAAAHAEIARLNGSLATARDVFVTQRAEIATLRARLATLAAPGASPEIVAAILSEPNTGEFEPVATALAAEVAEADRDARLFRRALSRIESPDDDCPI